MRVGLSLLLFIVTLLPVRLATAEPAVLPAPPLRTAFGSRCTKSPIPCNRIDYFTASFHLADIILLPSTDTRGFGATVGYGMSMSLFHRLEVGIGGTAAIWNQPTQGLLFQNGPALLNVKGVLFPLLRNPLPDTEFTFALHLQQQLRIPKFDGPNDLGTLSPLTALRAVADKPFWRMGITGSLGFLLTQGRTDSELAASVRLHIPGMSRATVQSFGVLQGLFGSSRTVPLRGGFGLSVHFAWDNGTSLSGGYVHARGEGAAPSAIYLGGPDYRIGRETAEHSYSRPPIPNREMVPSPWPWLIDKLRQEWNEAELANEAHRRGEDWLNDECFLYEEGKYDRPLRHLGKRDASGKFCNVGGKFVPMDAPLREVGGDFVPVTTPQAPQAPTSVLSAPPVPSSTATPPPASPSTAEPVKSSRNKSTRSSRRAAHEAEPDLPAEVAEKLPAPQSQLPNPSLSSAPPAAQPSLGESAKQFAKGFAHGVGAASLQIYNDTKELPTQLAKTGREILEDIHANRRVRALAPLAAMEHALRNASRKDVERIAHAVVDTAKEWLDKPAYEKGESLGRATTAIASEVAIDVLTEGIGSVATLRKVGKVAEAADHVRDAERVVQKVRNVEQIAETTHDVNRLSGGAYRHLPEPQAVGPGRVTTPAQRRRILEANRERNGGSLVSDSTGEQLVPATASRKGSVHEPNEAHIDHVEPRSRGGTNSNENLRVIGRDENLRKGNKTQ
jgi:hypothetical protein